MDMFQVIKVVLVGVIEGVTEWLPVSSTGHIMIFEKFFPLDFSEGFKEVFEYSIQLGAIFAVLICFSDRLFFIKNRNEAGRRVLYADKGVLSLYLKVLVACLPAVLAIPVDKLVSGLSDGTTEIIVVSLMLAVYGGAFIAIEKSNKFKTPKINSVGEIDLKTAFIIGLFQVLAAIPGTSRSGVTIIGALILGVSRCTAAEFTFFLALPTILGASGYKLLKFALNGGVVTLPELWSLVLGAATAFVVSLFTIKFLMNFVKKHDFTPFGIYRIILGVLLAVICLVL